MDKLRRWFNSPTNELDITIMLIVGFAFAMWSSGCVNFIHGVIKSDILEAKIKSELPTKAIFDATRDRRHPTYITIEKVRGKSEASTVRTLSD